MTLEEIKNLDGEVLTIEELNDLECEEPGRSILRKMGCTFINVTSLVRT